MPLLLLLLARLPSSAAALLRCPMLVQAGTWHLASQPVVAIEVTVQ
jgi:hypothetical protein